MDGAVVLALIALLAAHVGDVAASCREVPNDDMLEYLCENGHPDDLAAVPAATEKLRISRMPLRRITADTFAKFGDNLWVLSCSNCEINDIETNAFRRLINLQQLNLENNYLTAVKATWFEGLNSLTYLNVNYNDIHDVEDGVYRNLPALVDFRISGNRLRCLNLDGMSHLRQLKRMFLSENPEFACPHAVSEFLENQHVTFDRDPEWRRLAHDAIKVHVPPTHVEEEKEVEEEEDEARDQISVPAYHERLPDRRPPPEAPVAPPLTEDSRTFHPAEYYGRRRRPMTTTTTTTSTTMRPITMQPHVPRVEPIPPYGSARTSYQTPPEQPQSSRPAMSYPIPETPRVPFQESRPPLEDARMTAEADRLPLTEDVLMYPSHVPAHDISSYPYVTSEKSRELSVESRPSSEDIRIIAGTDKTPSAEHTLTYISPYETTTAYPSHATSEGSRVPLIESRPSEDTTGSTTAKPGRPMLTEHSLTYPYESTRETMSYPYPYITSERSRVPVAESEASSEDEMTTWSDGSSRAAEDTVTYPLYSATPEGQAKMPQGSIQVTRPWPTSDSGASVTSQIWSTDDSMEHHPDDSSQDAGRHPERPSSWPTMDTPTSREMPYHVSHEPTGRDYTPGNKMAVDDRWSSSSNFFIATNLPIEAERSRTTTATSPDDEDADKEDLHYVRPVSASQPELIQPISTDEFYPVPYYESTVTVHPPHNYRGYHDDDEPTTVIEATTDKPLPDCPKRNSAPQARPASVLAMSIVVVIFGRVIVAGF